jgi:hypothetical protein
MVDAASLLLTRFVSSSEHSASPLTHHSKPWRVKFSLVEDMLILYGYATHQTQWGLLRTEFLPTKSIEQACVSIVSFAWQTPRQIHDRFRNMRAARSQKIDSPFQWIVQVVIRALQHLDLILQRTSLWNYFGRGGCGHC